MRLNEGSFNKIKYGSKRIELRLNDTKRQIVENGDSIVFVNCDNHTKKVSTNVIDKTLYRTFEELIDNEPIEIFGGKTREELKQGVYSIYSREQEKKFGVVGIKFSII